MKHRQMSPQTKMVQTHQGWILGDTFSNEEAVPAVGDDGTTDDAKNAAAEYLKTNYVDKNKIISNGEMQSLKAKMDYLIQ